MTTQGPGISTLTLWVQDPAALAAFYCNVLGMQRLDHAGEIAVGYGGAGAALVLCAASTPPPAQDKLSRYWKIALTLPDLDHAHAEITAKGVEVTHPHQFRDIARMSHLADAEGHVIELIQHSFEGKPLTQPGDPAQPLGGGAQIGLITLRTGDIEAEMQTCLHDLGMRYLSRQSLADLGFDLYFFALTQDQLPHADINALENREWLWQRPYTVLEFQHRLDVPAIQPAETEAPEVAGINAHGQPFQLR